MSALEIQMETYLLPRNTLQWKTINSCKRTPDRNHRHGNMLPHLDRDLDYMDLLMEDGISRLMVRMVLIKMWLSCLFHFLPNKFAFNPVYMHHKIKINKKYIPPFVLKYNYCMC